MYSISQSFKKRNVLYLMTYCILQKIDYTKALDFILNPIQLVVLDSMFYL